MNSLTHWLPRLIPDATTAGPTTLTRRRSPHILAPQPPTAPRAVLKVAATLHRLLYRWSSGRLGGVLRGGPVLLLSTTGRKTGRERTWPLSYLVLGDDLVLVASAGGQPCHPAWYLNLRADPRVRIQVADQIWSMVARTTSGTERARLWAHVMRRYPVAGTYQRQTSRQFPVVTLHRAAPIATPLTDDERSNTLWPRLR